MQKEAYKNLANAIILSAVNDYKKLLIKYKKNPTRYTFRQLKYIENFFKSDYCNSLTKLNTEQLILDIRRSINGK